LFIGVVVALGCVSAAPTPSINRGKLLFLRCASCHDISDKPSSKTGPNLSGVFERRAGSLPGYRYSAAMKAQDFVWNAEMLDRWLARPSDVVPGTAMAFVGMSNKTDREALIAYLRTPVK
jgi:cytochrome c